MNVKSENHNAMQTVVELYLDKELSDITFDVEALDEWKELGEQLGMTKQLELTKGKESPVPFPYMNESMSRIYKMLCPTVVDFKEYNKTPIPLEVLKQISFCVKENHFNSIQIWHDDKAPDPLVVGLTGYWYVYDKSSYSRLKDDKGNEIQFNELEAKKYINENNGFSKSFNETGKYLVARWGDVKRSFEELKGLAKERFIEKHGAKMKTDIEQLSGKLKNLKENATLYLLGEISESAATTSSNW